MDVKYFDLFNSLQCIAVALLFAVLILRNCTDRSPVLNFFVIILHKGTALYMILTHE